MTSDIPADDSDSGFDATDLHYRAARALAAHFGPYPFTLRECELQGVSRKQLRTLVHAGEVEHLRFNCYALAHSSVTDRHDYLTRVSAALSRRWNAVGSHESAAAALGLPKPTFTPWRSHLVVVSNPGKRVRERRGILELDMPRDAESEVRTAWGPVTGLPRTAYELAASRPLRESLIVADAVARRLADTDDRWALSQPRTRRAVRDRMIRLAENWTDPTNHQQALAVLRMADPAADSPAESFARAVIITAGLPPPRVGAPVQGDEGQQYFADLSWEGPMVIAEVDGIEKYGDPDALLKEKMREDALRRAGWRVVRWTGRESVADPRLILRRLPADVA
jgi:hypothetical protein